MGPLTYSLCHKPVIGLAMWICGLCHFPPPIPQTPVSLQQPGPILRVSFEAPVDKSYLLAFQFVFPSVEARLRDELVGDGRQTPYCSGEMPWRDIPEQARAGLGRSIPLRVVVRRQDNDAVVAEKVFHSLCSTSHATNDKGRSIGRLQLQHGGYHIEVFNMEAQPEFSSIRIALHLVSGDAK